MLSLLTRFAWSVVRAVLPYPDLPRRAWMRRRAFRLVTLPRWPTDDSVTGSDAAQLALLRALHLQRLAHRAARYRHGEETALVARTAIDNVLVGLYCLHHDEAAAKLTGGENLAIRRTTAYLTRDDGLFSSDALQKAADALGERGHDLNLKDVAVWLDREKELPVAVQLYEGYYSALSHFFQHSSGFALMRHVDSDGKLRRHPNFPWARQSAVRITDGCTGLMVWAIADKTGIPAEGFLRYANVHLSRTLTPMFVVAAKGSKHQLGWRNLLGVLKTVTVLRRCVRSPDPEASAAAREEHVRKLFESLLSALAPDVPDAAFRPVVNELVGKVLASMNLPPADLPIAETAAQPNPASASEPPPGSPAPHPAACPDITMRPRP